MKSTDVEDLMSRRNREIVDKRVGGMTLGQIAREYGLTRERVRQICTREEPDHTDKSRAAREQREMLAEQERRFQWEREVEASDRTCAVCLSNMHPSTPARVKTCGGECAEVWAKARYHLDRDQWSRHRESVARSILNHADKRRESEIAWAERVVAGDAPEPRGRWFVAGSEVERLVTEVVPRLRGTK